VVKERVLVPFSFDDGDGGDVEVGRGGGEKHVASALEWPVGRKNVQQQQHGRGGGKKGQQRGKKHGAGGGGGGGARGGGEEKMEEGKYAGPAFTVSPVPESVPKPSFIL